MTRRADPRSRPRGDREGLHRAAHRRRVAPPASVRVVPRHHRQHPPRVPGPAPEGVDRGGVGLVRAADEAADEGAARRDEGRRARQPAGRRGGDLPPGGAREDLRLQGRRRPVAAGAPRVARTRRQVERDHALRPHREAGAPHRSPAAPSRTAGRDRRVPDVHPAGVPPGQQPARAGTSRSRPA